VLATFTLGVFPTFTVGVLVTATLPVTAGIVATLTLGVLATFTLGVFTTFTSFAFWRGFGAAAATMLATKRKAAVLIKFAAERTNMCYLLLLCIEDCGGKSRLSGDFIL
jgi:hypothetical protein